MTRSRRWFDALQAAGQSALYSPVWVLPALLIGQTFVPEIDSWWIRKLHGFRDNPMTAWPVVGCLVIWRPLIIVLVKAVLMLFGIVIIHKSWAELLGDQLVDRIRRGLPADDIGTSLLERAEEGNVDVEHLDVALWLWVYARYTGNLSLERKCVLQVDQLLTNEALRQRAKVWYLRATVHFSRIARDVMPPLCSEVLRRW